MLKARPSPRSAIFSVLVFLSTKRFCGLRSRCRTPCLWQCVTPLISWYMKLFTTFFGMGVLFPVRSMYFFRSVSRYSKTR